MEEMEKEIDRYQPSFFTKIGTGMLLNAVGDTNSKHETVSVYKKTVRYCTFGSDAENPRLEYF